MEAEVIEVCPKCGEFCKYKLVRVNSHNKKQLYCDKCKFIKIVDYTVKELHEWD